MKHYYVICSHCGANLDPGEKCECKESRQEIAINQSKDKLIKTKKPLVLGVRTTSGEHERITGDVYAKCLPQL